MGNICNILRILCHRRAQEQLPTATAGYIAAEVGRRDTIATAGYILAGHSTGSPQLVQWVTATAGYMTAGYGVSTAGWELQLVA